MSETLRPAFNLAGTLDTISGFMYTYVLVALLIGAGLYFFTVWGTKEQVDRDPTPVAGSARPSARACRPRRLRHPRR